MIIASLNISMQAVFFREQQVRVGQSCCWDVEERTLTFSKHQTLLKSKYYSWWNLQFSNGVDYFYMVVRKLEV